MKLATFTAENAQAAVRAVQAQLGPEAVIVSVRPRPVQGLARLLPRGQQVEVVAGIPEAPAPARHVVPPNADAYSPFSERYAEPEPPVRAPQRWRSVAWLESLGLLPEYADRLEQKIISYHGPLPPVNPVEEWSWVCEALTSFWRPAPAVTLGDGRPHVFIGPAGSGKTTALAKWLTNAVLRGNQNARVWRLDGETANTAESLSLHCEMLGVPCERQWTDEPVQEELLFVDLPGVETRGLKSLAVLRDALFALPQPHIHLVLNAAYDTKLLFEQFHALAPLLPEDVIFTHLDEEHRRVKLWNFVLGINCSVGWLGAGQKLPGEFRRAEAALLFPHDKPQ